MQWFEFRHRLVEAYSRQFVLKQWNLKKVKDGWQNAVGYGHVFSEEDIEYMMKHGVVPPTPVRRFEEPQWMRGMTTAEIINMMTGDKSKSKAKAVAV